MARLSANGTELVRLRKVSPSGQSSVTLSFRSNGVLLQKLKNGTYDSGWKVRTRGITDHKPHVESLKEKGWQEVSV